MSDTGAASGRHRPSRHRRRAPRRLARTAALLAAGAVALLLVQMPGANGAYTAKIANSGDSATSNPYFTCTAAAMGETASRATFAYPFGENVLSGLFGAADVSGNDNPGTYSNLLNLPLGVTSGVSNTGSNSACARDGHTVITLDGVLGSVSGPATAVAAPTTFTLEIWFRTTTGGGKLIGFGNTRTGTSTTYDRQLYLDNAGHVIFGVRPTAPETTVASPKTYTNGTWHYAAATLSPTAGMALYVDGVQVGSDTTTKTAQPGYSGYWRIGYDNLANVGATAPSNFYFKGSLTYAAAYNSYALSSAQVAAHYAAGA